MGGLGSSSLQMRTSFPPFVGCSDHLASTRIKRPALCSRKSASLVRSRQYQSCQPPCTASSRLNSVKTAVSQRAPVRGESYRSASDSIPIRKAHRPLSRKCSSGAFTSDFVEFENQGSKRLIIPLLSSTDNHSFAVDGLMPTSRASSALFSRRVNICPVRQEENTKGTHPS